MLRQFAYINILTYLLLEIMQCTEYLRIVYIYLHMMPWDYLITQRAEDKPNLNLKQVRDKAVRLIQEHKPVINP